MESVGMLGEGIWLGWVSREFPVELLVRVCRAVCR